MRKTLAATVLIVQNTVAFIVGLHCATSVQCLKRTGGTPGWTAGKENSYKTET